ncbi:DUF1573 domain-containing protein [bacterium]|nr:MAG: DUF1573 domain-containing protein [bacterium]
MIRWLGALFIYAYLGFFSQVALAQDIKAEIYSKLKNPRCNMALSECNCPEAKEIKGYIAGLLDAGTAKDDIFYKVAKKFTLKAISDNGLKLDIENKLIQEAGENRPQIALEPKDYFDFGSIDKNQGEVRKVFKLYNRGKADLVIRNIRVSCSCVSVSLIKVNEKSPYFGVNGAPEGWRAELKPNEGADLEVVIDLNHKSVREGDLLREIMISSNDPVNPESSVTVKAKVIDKGASSGQHAQGNSEGPRL